MNIREIQTALSALAIARAQPEFSPGRIDGLNGDKTRKAVMAFQKFFQLEVDGKAGPQTQKALKEALEPPLKNARPEPDKGAINAAEPPLPPTRPGSAKAAPPPNIGGLTLFDTNRKLDTIFVHCTATPEGKDYTVADIRAWHKARGWSDIGYHYVIYRDGRVMVGRPVGQVGAHVENHNTGSIGISYVGGLTADGKKAKDTRTPAQRSSLLWLTQTLMRKHKGIKRVRGHNEVAAKACPSFIVKDDQLGKLAA